MHLSKLPVKQAKLFRDTQNTSVHKIFGLSLFKKKILKKITDVKVPDLSIENICLFGF